jgi:hypothetical protein
LLSPGLDYKKKNKKNKKTERFFYNQINSSNNLYIKGIEATISKQVCQNQTGHQIGELTGSRFNGWTGVVPFLIRYFFYNI